ncbi:UNKNOWN [Stylonychia lemnae]|uniref:Uncharacterized protein n=1 Tax=Stylonychia lemnae TaxID=5949 RepID=A0A078AKZ6_STYLE|nr:UNKNOWN [Stylonychia lemnae]|eukprot:CDW83040.1 UNKNOWN [Stylonychia lemnae]
MSLDDMFEEVESNELKRFYSEDISDGTQKIHISSVHLYLEQPFPIPIYFTEFLDIAFEKYINHSLLRTPKDMQLFQSNLSIVQFQFPEHIKDQLQPAASFETINQNLMKRMNKQYLMLFIKLKGTKNDEFYQLMPLIIAYGIKQTIVDLILYGSDIFKKEDQFIQMIQFIHNMIYGIDISYSYAQLLKSQFTNPVQSQQKLQLQKIEDQKISSIQNSPTGLKLKNAFKRRNAFSLNTRSEVQKTQLDQFDQELQKLFDEKQLKEFNEKKKRLLRPNFNPTKISSFYGKQMQQKQSVSALEKFETNVLSPSLLQEFNSTETNNPLRMSENRKLKHIKSLVPVEIDRFEKEFKKIAMTARYQNKKQKKISFILDKVQHSLELDKRKSRLMKKELNQSISLETLKPTIQDRYEIKPDMFMVDTYQQDKKQEYRELLFKVGVNISDQGNVSESKGLGHMEKLRQILKYKPGDKNFNMNEINDILRKTRDEQLQSEIAAAPVVKYQDEEQNKIRFPQIKKRKFKNKEAFEDEDLNPIDKQKQEQLLKEKIKIQYLERVMLENEIFNKKQKKKEEQAKKNKNGGKTEQSDYEDDDQGIKFQSKFIKENSENLVKQAMQKRDNPKKTQLELINIAEKLRKIKLKFENQTNSLLNDEQTANEFDSLLDKLKDDYKREQVIARKMK